MSATTRRARLVVDRAVLRLLLDLPGHVQIDGYRTSSQGDLVLELSGPYLPEPDARGNPRYVRPVYRRVDVFRSELVELRGIDT